MGNIIEDRALRNKFSVFEDRKEAGLLLSDKLKEYKNTDTIILAIPSGGVPVAAEVVDKLKLPFDLIVVRKIQIPYNLEAGFGAMDPDGEVVLNRELLDRLILTDEEIDRQIKKTREIISKREMLFRKGMPLPYLKDKIVIIIDDGLASGYTMLCAIRFVRKRSPKKIIVAVPTGLDRTVNLVNSEADDVVCLNIRTSVPFAVADAYRNWYDLSDQEVIDILERYTSTR
jgi:predicted phosphoribosyltransferase